MHKEQVRKWVHKESKATIKATPWWEIPEEMFSEEDFGPMAVCGESIFWTPGQQKMRIGALTQVGWLLMNESEVWLGVGMAAQEAFDDVGPWKVADKTKKAKPKPVKKVTKKAVKAKPKPVKKTVKAKPKLSKPKPKGKSK